MTEKNNLRAAFAEAHKELVVTEVHVTDLQNALSGMQAELAESKKRLSAIQVKDAAAISKGAPVSGACRSCGRGLGDGGPYLCLSCGEKSEQARAAVSQCEASISGTTLNLITAKAEVETARMAEMKSFEQWVQAEYDQATSELLTLLEKSYRLAARIDALSAAGRQRQFKKDEFGRGAFVGVIGEPQKVENAILGITFRAMKGSSTQLRDAKAKRVGILRHAIEKVAEECFLPLPGGKRPEAKPQPNNLSLVGGGSFIKYGR